MRTVLKVAVIAGSTVLLRCNADMGTGPAELKAYKVIFARNTSALNVPNGTERRIYITDGDGSDLQDLSQHPSSGYPGIGNGWDSAPQFSPDGRLIAFQTNREGNQELYVMQGDGSNKTNITREGDLDLEYSWSPDGARIVFTRLLQGKYVIHVVGSNGSGMIPLTSLSDNARYPAWSPAGNQIAFSLFDPTTSRWRVLLMNTDGSNLQSLSDSTESAVFPQWSKDGTRVYYVVLGSGLRLKNLDGSFPKSLPGFFPRTIGWGSDGRWFVSSDSLGIAVISADLSSFSRWGIRGFDPLVSADGGWILFLAQNGSGVAEIHAVRSDGTDERVVTASQYGDLFPSWRPN